MAVSGIDTRPVPSFKFSAYELYFLGLLFAITVLNYMDRGILGVMQELIKRDLNLTDRQLGILSGPAFALLYSVAAAPIARLAERRNRATLLATAVGLWSAMTALCGVATGYLQLALCRVGVGAGEGGCIPTSHSLIADRFAAHRRGFVMAIVSSAPGMAGILTPILGSHMAHRFGWRAAFVMVGAPGLLVAVIVKLTLREPRAAGWYESVAPPRTSLWRDVRWLFGQRAFVYLFLAAAFTGVGVTSVNAFRISFLMRSHGLPLTSAGTVWGAAGAFGLLGALLGGYVSDRFADARGRAYVWIPSIAGIITWMAYLIAFSQSDWTLVVCAIFVATFAYYIKDGPEYAAVQNIVPPYMRATGAMVFMVAATAIGGFIGPAFTGAVSDAMASRSFGSDAAQFAAACPGGRALATATASVGEACARASAHGLQAALVIVSFVFLVAALLLFLSGLNMRSNSEPGGRIA